MDAPVHACGFGMLLGLLVPILVLAWVMGVFKRSK